VPLITDLQLARAVVEALRQRRREDLGIVAWNDYLAAANARTRDAG
jgi:carbamoyl-phosphate synthase large subunit